MAKAIVKGLLGRYTPPQINSPSIERYPGIEHGWIVEKFLPENPKFAYLVSSDGKVNWNSANEMLNWAREHTCSAMLVGFENSQFDSKDSAVAVQRGFNLLVIPRWT